jgi:hypothetical protein
MAMPVKEKKKKYEKIESESAAFIFDLHVNV